MSPTQITRTGTLRRTAALLCAALAGLSFAGTVRAQSPIPDPTPSPAAPTPYSSPLFHAGGVFTPPNFAAPLPVPFPDPLYSELMGTPTALVPGRTLVAGVETPNGTYDSTIIPSFLLGNWDPARPPTTPGTFFPNHFRDGTAFSWSAPLTFLTPGQTPPGTSVTGAPFIPTVESTPTAVNVSEYPFIKTMQYVGTVAGTASTADTGLYTGSTVPGQHSGSAPLGSPYYIRQVVYFGRSENITTTTGTAPNQVTTNTPCGAIYCVDGFTGEVIWRYQTPYFQDTVVNSSGNLVSGSYRDPAVFSTPAVTYMNVLTNAATGAYANKAVVIVGDNNGFVYCLDAAGNGDGTSNISATNPPAGSGIPGQPIYGAQPPYGSTTSATSGSHVGTTSQYWVYRPDVRQPHPSAGSSINFDRQTVLPVPGPFGLASPNIYVERSVTTTPDPVTGTLPNNAVIYMGNTRDCVYAFDGLGVSNASPPYNASLPGTQTGIPNAVPTCSPRWWFTPDNASLNGTSFESTPAISPPVGPFPTATVITATPNPVQPGGTITYTATVTDESGNGGAPTGTVTLTSSDGATITPTAPGQLVNGTETFTATAPATGQILTVTGSYSGDGTFSGSAADTFYEDVDGGAGTFNTVITSSNNPAVFGQSVTFTATVTNGGPVTTPAAGGTVVFNVDGAAQPAQTTPTGTATYTTAALPIGQHTVVATYSVIPGTVAATGRFTQTVYGPIGPTVYIGSSQELGGGSNAGRVYAIDGFYGPKLAGTAGGPGHAFDQRPIWAYPSLYAKGPGTVTAAGAATPIGLRPALGNITGSPVVFTNLDDTVAAVGVVGTAGYVPAHPRTRVYFAADTGVEVPFTVAGNAAATRPDPRPGAETTGRVWAVETNGTTALTTATTAGVTTKTVWSFPEANDPNNPASDSTPEPSPPIGAFLYATPAMGYVQFPTAIQYGPAGGYTDYTHADTVNTDVKGKTVPMLYIGTDGAADLGFYAVDVDGSSDAERGVYRLESPDGSPFTSSPVVVANSSTTGGNGGAVYATAGNSLFQFTATPISNINASQAFAFVGVDATFTGGGPLSGPAVAAADTFDITPATYTGTQNVTDFVYFGDGQLGFCRGITPIDKNDGGAVPPGSYGPPTDVNKPGQGSNKFFLQTYLFDGTANHSATDTYMATVGTGTSATHSLPLNSTVSGFEWGGYVYVRLGNVVPPGFDPASPDPSLLVADPTDPTLFYGSGQAVTFSLGSASVSVLPTTTSGGVVSPNIKALTAANVTYPGAFFTQRSDPAVNTTANPPAPGPNTSQLLAAGSSATPFTITAGLGWIAAYSYPIGGDVTRIGDTPGAFRRISNARQNASVYTLNPDGTYSLTGSTTLNIQTGHGSQYPVGDPPTALAQTAAAIEQPTFGILNPLAVGGFGVPLLSGGTTAAPVGDPNGAGPFGAVSASLTQADKAAYANGSMYITNLPNSGYDVTRENPTNVTQYITDQANYHYAPISVITSVGDIPDGGTGTNEVTGLPSSLANGSVAKQFGLVVENRSLIGTDRVGNTSTTDTVTGRPLFPAIPLAMQGVNAHWNDNTSYPLNVSLPQNAPNGPGATINPLPWEDWASVSSIAANTSQDYPDIPASAIAHTLFTSGSGGGSLGLPNGNAQLDFTTKTNSGAIQRTPDYIEVAVTPPPHQPANLQLWDSIGQAALTPVPASFSGTTLFPQGYIEGSGTGTDLGRTGGTPQRIFVDVSGLGSRNFQSSYPPPYPYRNVQTFSGVLVTMKTAVTDGTISLPPAPSGLGIQTEDSALGLFDPYLPGYQPFFKPVTVQNQGNTNLLNVQFDQQMTQKNGAAPLQTLYAYSDSNDILSNIGAFDYSRTSGPINTSFQRLDKNGAVIPLPGTTNINEQAFQFVTSLDTNIVKAYGRNPYVISASNPLNSNAVSPRLEDLYPAATFRKPRPGNGPTTLMVPDKPDAGDPNYSVAETALPVIGSSSLPYVGIALPFGTPVGTYHTLALAPLRVFEGLDPTKDANNSNITAPNPYLPPSYGGSVGGHAAVPNNSAVTALPLDINNNFAAPVSDPSLTLQTKVLEDRFTDGYTYGALPMVDTSLGGLTSVPQGQTPAPTATSDFAPAAFRGSGGSLSLYWTSGRTPGVFTIYGANVPFSNTNGNYFHPGAPASQWWVPLNGYNANSPTLLNPVSGLSGTGTNSGLSVETGPGTGFVPHRAYDVVVSSAVPHTNTLYSYEVDPQTGGLSNAQPLTPASDNSQVKYGVRGLNTGTLFTDNTWAFWTGTTRGRTALYYSAALGQIPSLLPLPAGLTAVTDAAPTLMPFAPVALGGTTTFRPVIEVTYSGTAPAGGSDLYVSRYLPDAKTAAQLDLVPFPVVTENLRAAGAWYQARDVGWSQTGALNVTVPVPDLIAKTPYTFLLYNAAGTPLFTKAVYDKASGLLVLTGVKVPYVTPPAAPAAQYTVNSVYIDSATGRIRFAPALLPTQTFAQIRGTFSPTARRLTVDSQANTAAVSFMDTAQKTNDATGVDASRKPVFGNVEADRRWTIWRKSGGGGSSLNFLTQRLTYFLPSAIGLSSPAAPATPAPLLTSVSINGGADVSSQVDVDYARGRLYFPLSLNAEGQTVVVRYTDTQGTARTTPTDAQNTVEWQDEVRANTNEAPPTDSVAGLDTVLDGTPVPETNNTNENNPAAFLDPLAGAASPHKVWLFWNSTRNGTSDIYSETIDPRFAPGPATP